MPKADSEIAMTTQEKLEELQETLDMFADPASRADLLIGFADKFKAVPADVATRPYPKSHQVPQCESEAYVWAQLQPDRTLKLHFAVENPSGISAKALAVILDSVFSGSPPRTSSRSTRTSSSACSARTSRWARASASSRWCSPCRRSRATP